MNDNKQTYTMKQIANLIGIDKTKVWRFIRDFKCQIKLEILAAHQ